jgi:hypothetical protein
MDGLAFSYGVGYQFKSLFGDCSWFYTHGLGSLITNGDWHLLSVTGIGFQLTQNFSTIISFSGVAHKYIAYYSLIQDPGIQNRRLY